MERFDFIEDCHGNTVLIDRRNQLPALPLIIPFNKLGVEDMEMLNRWLKYLNGDDVE